jgi:predicted ATP-dependent endonuclease of OLD family
MQISKINIKNFRLLKDMEFNCEKDLSIIVGKNNCGKTSFLSILEKCIGNSSIDNKFEYYDFNLAFQKKLYSIVQNRENFNEKFDDTELAGIVLEILISYEEDDNLANISALMLDLEPENKTIVLQFSYLINHDKFKRMMSDYEEYKEIRNKEEGENTFQKFISKNHKKYFEYTKKTVLYDYVNKIIDNTISRIIDKKTIDLKKIITFNSIDATRNVSNTDVGHLSSLSSNYYERTEGKDKESETIIEFENQIEETDTQLNSLYSGVFEKLIQKISKFGGIKEDETKIEIISSINSLNLLKNNTTVIYKDETNSLPETYNGLGYLNLISMIINIETLLSDFRKDKKDKEVVADINLLFIEEPEAHTHPQMQYVFIKNIKALLKEGKKLGGSDKEINLQTFMTTHSAHIVAESNFDDIKYFVKENDKYGKKIISKNLKELKTIYQKENGEDNNHYKFLRQYLTLNRSEVFFADKIILIEGDTERILLPAMMKKIDQGASDKTPLLSQNISVVEVGNYSQIFDNFIRFIGIKTLIITDIDSVNKDSKSCKVEEGKFTTNKSLKHYLKEKIEENEGDSLQILTKLTLKDKIIKASQQQVEGGEDIPSWTSDEAGTVLIVYQTKEIGYEGKEYNARSFEDAFFHINRELFTQMGHGNVEDNQNELKNRFQGLKNRDCFFDSECDAYSLAEKCVNKKPSLAMDILLNSKRDDSSNDEFSNWKTPKYIEEGLEWLQQD